MRCWRRTQISAKCAPQPSRLPATRAPLGADARAPRPQEMLANLLADAEHQGDVPKFIAECLERLAALKKK